MSRTCRTSPATRSASSSTPTRTRPRVTSAARTRPSAFATWRRTCCRRPRLWLRPRHAAAVPRRRPARLRRHRRCLPRVHDAGRVRRPVPGGWSREYTEWARGLGVRGRGPGVGERASSCWPPAMPSRPTRRQPPSPSPRPCSPACSRRSAGSCSTARPMPPLPAPPSRGATGIYLTAPDPSRVIAGLQVKPTVLSAVQSRWTSGAATLLADDAAAAALGPWFAADPVPSDVEAAAPEDLLAGGVTVAPGLGWVNGLTVTPRLLPGQRWGQVFQLIAAHPTALGAGVDVGTALEVRNGAATAHGANADGRAGRAHSDLRDRVQWRAGGSLGRARELLRRAVAHAVVDGEPRAPASARRGRSGSRPRPAG